LLISILVDDSGMVSMIKDIDAKDWDAEVLKSQKPVAVEFWHEYCMWSSKMLPDLMAVTDELPDITFVRINVRSSQDNYNMAMKYGITGTPTIKVFLGGRVIGEIIGHKAKPELKALISSIVEKGEAAVASSSPMG
jgi:thioredoxin 1